MYIQRIEQSDEQYTINALHYSPDDDKKQSLAVIMGHGFSSSKHHLDGLAAYLCYFGYEVVNLDFPGHKMGGSRGPLTHPTQLNKAFQLARNCTEQKKIVVLGHSMGGAAAIHAATTLDGVVGLVVLGMGANPAARFGDEIVTRTLAWGSMYVENVEGKTFLQQVGEELIPKMEQVTVPSLVIGGTKDFIVPTNEVKRLAEMPKGENTLKFLECRHSEIPEKGKKEIREWLDNLQRK